MINISFIIIEIISLMSFIIIIFIYSALSTDTLTICICIILFLVLLLPFFAILNHLKLILLELNLESFLFCNSIIIFSIVVNLFIGLYLFIELIYVIFFN